MATALRDDATWSSRYGPGLAYGEVGSGVLVSSDPPGHTTERLAISRAFRPSVIDALKDDVIALVAEMIDGFERRLEGDVITDLAMPLPLTVMCWLLGMPKDDIELFRTWVLPMAEAVALAGGLSATPEVTGAYASYYAYFVPHIQRRAEAIAAGGEAPDDLLTRLLTVERNGRGLSQAQVVGFCQFLLVAGSATTTLLRQCGGPAHRVSRADGPRSFDRSLVANAIEESLRFDAPVHGLFRTNSCPVDLHGVEAPAESKVYMMFGSANRDPEAWEAQERFDVTRDLKDLKKHAAFGVGVRYCLGAPLARLEASIALDAILDRLPNLRTDGAPTKVKASVLKGYETLPVRWDSLDGVEIG